MTKESPHDIVHVLVPMHRSERDRIKDRAKLAGVSLKEYVRSMCIDGKLQRKAK